MAEALSRLRPQTLTTSCYDVLKQAILDLQLAPGTVLVEQEIARQLGISKTPVRETIARLTGEGLVTTGDNRRPQVAGLSLEMIYELYSARVTIEPPILLRTAPLLTADDLSALQAIVDSASVALKNREDKEFVQLNEQFHLYFVRKLDNRYLLGLLRDLFDHVHRVRAVVQQAESEKNEELLGKFHQGIIDSISEQKFEQAANVLQDDIQQFLLMIEDTVMQETLRSLEVAR